MTNAHEATPSPRQYAEQILQDSKSVLKDAVELVFPETPDADPREVFPTPAQLRSESPDLPLTEEKKQMLLSRAESLGFGNPENVTLSEQGLIGATVIIEGGQPHKMLAEARMVLDDTSAQPRMIIISATPHRQITVEGEKASAQRLFGKVGATEYDVAVDVAHSLPGFTAYQNPEILNAGYDVENNFAVSKEPSGQFQTVGEVNGVPLVLMKIDRKDLGEGKYEKQPNASDVIGIVNAVTRGEGDESSPIVHVTSGTYRPSRALEVALASLTADRLVGIATYGNNLLNEIKGSYDAPPLGQLPSELQAMAVQAEKLQAALNIL